MSLPLWGETEFRQRGNCFLDRKSNDVRVRAIYLLEDRKSTRLNSSHSQISYAVFCLKKKTKSVSFICTVSMLDVKIILLPSEKQGVAISPTFTVSCSPVLVTCLMRTCDDCLHPRSCI